MNTSLEWLDSLQGSGIRPGLGRIRAVLRVLGHPHRAYPSIIVAGTNGKGSTSAMLTSILNTSGYRTGLYTSPHLVDLRERWMIGGAMIDPALLHESIDAMRDAALRANIEPTYFEALTIIAFIAFERAKCDVVVLEVGMGGRLDATNVVKPLAALITPIGFDHMEFLGDTLRRIASEKAGVIHRGAIVLTSNREPIVLEVLRRRAKKFGSELHVVYGDDSTLTPLAGAFQRDNVALAARTAHELASRFPRITDETIARGIAATKWRGRLEHLRDSGKDIWIDGCHNAHAAIAVAPFIAENVPRPRTLVFGIMNDKDVADVGHALFPLFDRVIATVPYPPRSAEAEMLAARARSRGIDAIAVTSPRAALQHALDSDARAIFVGGSLYLAGAAIEFFDERHAGE